MMNLKATSISQPTNAHIISHKTLLKHFKTIRQVSILSDHHQGALFLAEVILQYSKFNSGLQTRCCGSIRSYHVVWECVVEQWLGVRRTTLKLTEGWLDGWMDGWLKNWKGREEGEDPGKDGKSK